MSKLKQQSVALEKASQILSSKLDKKENRQQLYVLTVRYVISIGHGRNGAIIAVEEAHV